MYKGSIPDAINQSRREKKLFVVYISGEDEASSSLEQSSLIDENVVEVIGRCCILLHLKQGNVDASQFSAIYPQKSVPSISVIGLNGVLLWNHDGYINSENLKESIEKAWAALHLQETAATLLTASLATRNSEPVNSATTVLPAQGGSSTLENPSDLSSQSPDVSGASEVAHSTDLVSQVPNSTALYEPLEINEKEGSKSNSDDKTVEKLGSTSTEFDCDLLDSSKKSNTVSSADSKGEDITPSAKRKNKDDGSHTSIPFEDTPSTLTNKGVSSQSRVEQDKATSFVSVKSDDIQLSIRMPSGNRLEIKLTKQDVLRKVKNFVDENQGNGLGSYDLSLVYPKRVFSEQDMEATLSELGIQNRHAMIVVPHRQSGQVSRRHSSASYDMGVNSGADDVGGNSGAVGYFGYLRTVLSYVNPLSYLRGNTNSSNTELQSNEGLRQLRHGSGPWSEPRPLGNRGHEVTDADSANTLRRRPRPFGANIHTLGSEDHGPSDERNVFWNGNSTEFGGDDRK